MPATLFGGFGDPLPGGRGQQIRFGRRINFRLWGVLDATRCQTGVSYNWWGASQKWVRLFRVVQPTHVSQANKIKPYLRCMQLPQSSLLRNPAKKTATTSGTSLTHWLSGWPKKSPNFAFATEMVFPKKLKAHERRK